MDSSERTAGKDDVGRSCPYCRFALKEGGAATVCGECSAVHHTDCWADNGGCAVVGCLGGPGNAETQARGEGPPPIPPAPPRPVPPPQPDPPPEGGSSRSVGLIAAAIVVLALAVAGVAVAVVVTQGSTTPYVANTSTTGDLTTATTDAVTTTTVTETTTVVVPAAPPPPPEAPPPPPPPTDSSDDWPGGSGYTTILASVASEAQARRVQARASASGLDAGVLLSSNYRSLRPGYWVVFSGTSTSKHDADRRTARAKSLGFGAYPRFVSE